MDRRHFAKALRQNMTHAERLLWKHLRAHRLCGQKFRRQQPIGPYIVDFVHFAARLIVECDGGQHNESEIDIQRDSWLQEQGFKVLRFWNHDILNQTESVLTTIFAVLNPLSPNPSPARGEGNKGDFTHTDNGRTTPRSPNPSPARREGNNGDSIHTDTGRTTPLSPRGRGAGGEGETNPRGGKKQAKKRNHE